MLVSVDEVNRVDHEGNSHLEFEVFDDLWSEEADQVGCSRELESWDDLFRH